MNTDIMAQAFKRRFPKEYHLYELIHTFTSRVQEYGANKSWVDYATNHVAIRIQPTKYIRTGLISFRYRKWKNYTFSPKLGQTHTCLASKKRKKIRVKQTFLPVLPVFCFSRVKCTVFIGVSRKKSFLR